MAQSKSWKELMELQGASGGTSQQKANAMLELIEGRQPFSYDPNTDPAAIAARQETARNIARTTKDTLGSYAGMTGGMPSSAAVSAAAQAGNQAAVQGADKITELEQLARQNYADEGTQMQAYWSMLQGQADSEYSRQLQEQQLAYQKEQDAYNRSWNEEQRDYTREQAEYEQKYQLALLAAQYGDYSGLKELGVDTSKLGTSGYYYSGSGGSSGSGSSGSNSGGNDQSSGEQDDEAFNMLLAAYPGMTMSESEWAAAAAQYGEAKLVSWGFSKKAASSSGGNKTPNRETIGQPAKPAITLN